VSPHGGLKAASPQSPPPQKQNSEHTRGELNGLVVYGDVRMEWAPSRRVDAASKGQLGERSAGLVVPRVERRGAEIFYQINARRDLHNNHNNHSHHRRKSGRSNREDANNEIIMVLLFTKIHASSRGLRNGLGRLQSRFSGSCRLSAGTLDIP
jgi:hypothetical protein